MPTVDKARMFQLALYGQKLDIVLLMQFWQLELEGEISRFAMGQHGLPGWTTSTF